MKPVPSLVALVIALAAAPTAQAQPADGTDVANVNQWPMERVQLLDGREFFGLVQRQDKYLLELVEVRRPPGRGMHLLVRPIDQDDVFLIERLNPAERAELAARIDQFRNRTRVMAALLDSVRLARLGPEGSRFWRYEGPWFRLDSTADEATTRRAVVRVEQVFAGFRAFLEPLQVPRAPLTILLLDSAEQYRERQQELGISIKNPAFFLPRDNLIVAGSDLSRFSAELKRAREHHALLIEKQLALHAEVAGELQQLTAELEAAGVPEAKRRQVRRAAEVQSREALRRLEREVATAERRNRQLLEQVSEEMFVRLTHEAFHAYLELYVFDARRYDVPRWLNEGLAQVFEAGVVEANTLRLDAPNPEALAALQQDLRSGEPLPLAALLTAPRKTFLVGHESGIAAANRYYYYSWGLAHFLTFERQLLNSDRLEAYVRRQDREASPIERFEQLVGSPLEEFEPQWRDYILRLDEEGRLR